MSLTSSTWWGFQYLQNSWNVMAQNITYSPWGGTLTLLNGWTIIILSCLLSFASLIKLILWLKFFYRQKAGGGHGGKDHRLLLYFNQSHCNQVVSVNNGWVTNWPFKPRSSGSTAMLFLCHQWASQVEEKPKAQQPTLKLCRDVLWRHSSSFKSRLSRSERLHFLVLSWVWKK